MTGLHLSHYAIESELGRGGMGIVFRAKDTKLNRTVALKVLPAGALASEDDRARFRREAQAAAQLNHPNVCHVYQVDEATPTTSEGGPVEGHMEPRLFIAMEYIDGETLHDYVKKGPLKLQEAVNIAGQVAEALKEAHAKDIVHRDIKSANVMLTEGGVAKVLDFGLAKTNQSTMLTRMGSTLGTVAYMSPEQARGQEVDGRSDLYSLGTMLYEMVAGRLPYSGDYEQAVLYGILNEAPEPLTAVRTGVPMQLERVVDKLLKKEAEYRYQSAAGLLADLKSLDLSGSGHTMRSMAAMEGASLAGGSPAAVTANTLPKWIWGVMAGIAVLALAAGWLLRTPSQTDPLDLPVIRSTLDVLEGRRPPLGLDISRNGQFLAFTDFETVRVRDLQTGEEWAIPESGGVYGLEFNADGSWLLLESLTAVGRAPVRGGRPVQVPGPASASRAVWGPGGDTVLYHRGGTLMRVALGGGAPESILIPDTTGGPQGVTEPFVTRDGGTLLVKISGSDGQPSIGVYDYPSLRERAVISPGGDYPAYLESGHLVYNVSGEMMGRPFDLASATPLGPPAPIASDITPRAWSVSGTGLMASAYQIQNSASDNTRASLRLVRQYWDEQPEVLSVQPADYDDMSLARDGRTLVIETEDAGDDYLWLIDLNTGVRNQLTFRGTLGGGDDPAWSPDGDSVLYVDRAGTSSIMRVRAADGSGQSRVLLEHQGQRFRDPDWSPDRSTIVYSAQGEGTDDVDIWLLDVASGTTRPGISGGGLQAEARFSPDGRYLLYENSETGQEGSSVFVQPADLSGARWDVSRGLGYDPRWAPDGSAIYFRQDNTLVRVRVATEGGFRILGNPEVAIAQSDRVNDWTLLPDGSGIIHLARETPEAESGSQVDIPVDLVFNWFVEVEQKAPHPRDR